VDRDIVDRSTDTSAERARRRRQRKGHGIAYDHLGHLVPDFEGRGDEHEVLVRRFEGEAIW
jgi:hypothetical protein